MCAETGCKREVFEQGYCRHHYRIATRDAIIKRSPPTRGQCEAPNCDRVGNILRLCKGHYNQFVKRGHSPGFQFDKLRAQQAAMKPRRPMPPCIEPGCENPIRNQVRSLCQLHYGRFMNKTKDTRGALYEQCPVDECGRRMSFRSTICKRCRQFSWRYSLTAEQVISFFKKGRVCGNDGCRSAEDLHMDHDHSCCYPKKFKTSSKVSCGKCVRGWLCSSCNKSLGAMQESPERIRGLLDYLEKPQITLPIYSSS